MILMDMIWFMKQEEQILFILNKIIPEIELCKNIITIKKDIEKKDTRDYYNEIYKNIALEHKYLHGNHDNKYSYIFNRTSYIIKPDFDLTYYNYRGISYQIIELIHELIKDSTCLITNQMYKELPISITNYAIGRDKSFKEQDKLYEFLAVKITESLK